MRGDNRLKCYGIIHEHRTMTCLNTMRGQPNTNMNFHLNNWVIPKTQVCHSFNNNDSEVISITNDSSRFAQTNKEQCNYQKLHCNMEEWIITMNEMKKWWQQLIPRLVVKPRANKNLELVAPLPSFFLENHNINPSWLTFSFKPITNAHALKINNTHSFLLKRQHSTIIIENTIKHNIDTQLKTQKKHRTHKILS